MSNALRTGTGRAAAFVVSAALALSPAAAGTLHAQAPAADFTIEQVRSYPFPNELTAASTGSRIAWAFNERGVRNVYVAEGPDFTPRKVTPYDRDDGQELTSVSISPDGRWVVYVRGGEHGSNWDDNVVVNPLLSPIAPKMQLWVVPFEGGTPVALAEGGDNATIAPRGDVVLFQKDGQIWRVPIDGSAPARRMFFARGNSGSPVWSPDGTRLAFVSSRGDHSFIGIYTNDSTPITYVEPTTSRDGSPRWSPDGRRIAFVRRPGSGGAPDSVLVRQPSPWAIWIADATTGSARMLRWFPRTLRGSVPSTHGGTNLHWAARNRIVYMQNLDGWPHLYSLDANGSAGGPMLLTPGRYMAEHVTMSPDGAYMLFAANAGDDAGDIDRRHIVKVAVDRPAPKVLTPGTGLEWSPVVTGDGASIVFIGATAQRPPLPSVMPATGGAVRTLAEDRIPADFPTSKLVVPRQVEFTSMDGQRVHGQLFERAGAAGGAAGKPAIVYVHGGPPRQMLLGWNYSDYYANAYSLNQYLASLGYVVLSVNYRLGIGYGHDFKQAERAGGRGASEYMDVKAAGEYLRSLPQVDDARVGIYGGSYGGYLTALALGRDSDLFAAGVDWHGVHNYAGNRVADLLARHSEPAPDAELAAQVAWESSPVAHVKTWKSPVLLIHADDDRNVRFSETVDLARRLSDAGVSFEELVIPDDTHHWMLHANAIRVSKATAEYFGRVMRGR